MAELPAYERGEGAAVYSRLRPVFSVDLDAGAFFWLWEIVQAKHNSAQRPTFALLPEYVEMLNRAKLSFEAAADAKDAAIAAATAPAPSARKIPAKRSIKRKAPSAPAAPAAAKGIRRKS
jgi:hypothetical protein